MRTLSIVLPAAIVVLAVHAFAPAVALPPSDPRPVVGTVLSSGPFELAHITGTGTATVLAGDEIKVAGIDSQILLKNGTELHLAPHSTGTVFADHATLTAGSLSLQSSTPFTVLADTFTVTPTAPKTAAILQISGKTLTVNVTSGQARIVSSAGDTVANLEAGKTLAFSSLSLDGLDTNRSDTTVRLLGVLDNENGHYLVRDRFTNSVSEIEGTQVAPRLINHLVMVDGTWIGNDKSQVSQVDRMVKVSKMVLSDATTAIPCAADGVGGVAKLITLVGNLTKVRNHFLLQDQKKGTYEIVGDVNDQEIGAQNLKEKGFLLPNRPTILPAEQVVYVDNRKMIATASPCVGTIIGSTLVGTGIAAWPHNDVTSTAAAKVISF